MTTTANDNEPSEYRPTAEAIEAYKAESAALEAEVEADLAWLQLQYQQHLELLAWIVRQTFRPLDLRSEANWPTGCEVAASPVLSWLATRDLTIWHLARAQLSVEFSCAADEGPEALVQSSDLRLAIVLLSNNRPALRGTHGDKLARDMVLLSILRLFEEEAWDPWGLQRKGDQATDEDMACSRETGIKDWLLSGGRVSYEKLAMRLSDELSRHRFLVNFPEIEPTKDAIRMVWGKRKWPRTCHVSDRVFALRT